MQRLKTRNQFQAVLAGRIVARTAHFALHVFSLPMPMTVSETTKEAALPAPLFTCTDVWMGAMVPKRWARRAVTRNAIKRQIYSISDRFEPTLAKAAHVVRLRASFDRAQFVSASSDELKKTVRQEIELLFSKLTAARTQDAA